MCELDCWVSQWNRDQVAYHLHIHYNADYIPSEFVLQKLRPESLTEEQIHYIKSVQRYLRLDTVIDELFEGYNVEKLKIKADEILKSIMKEDNVFIRGKLKAFLRSFQRLLRECEEVGDKRKLYEGTLTQFVGDFAELCCLKPVFSKGNSKPDQMIWKDFRGIDKVICTHDICFFKEGTPDQCPLDMRVSVVEIKPDSELKSVRRRRMECPSKRCPYMHGLSLENRSAIRRDCSSKHCPFISDTSSESDSSTKLAKREEGISLSSSGIGSFSLDTSRTRLSKISGKAGACNTELEEPKIAARFHKKTLGQHAGELLFDLHRFCTRKDGVIHTVPGMIVDGTKVFFTVLEMSDQHYQKIKDNCKLSDEDRATIYYSGNFDILNESKRTLLVENFMSLNNLRQCSCQINDSEMVKDK